MHFLLSVLNPGSSATLQIIGIVISAIMAAGVALLGYVLNKRAEDDRANRASEAQERKEVAQAVQEVAAQAKEAANLVVGVALQAREAAELVRKVALKAEAVSQGQHAQLVELKRAVDSSAAMGVSTHKLVNSNLNEQKRLVVEGLEREATYLEALCKLLPDDESIQRSAITALNAARAARKEFEINEIKLQRDAE